MSKPSTTTTPYLTEREVDREDRRAHCRRRVSSHRHQVGVPARAAPAPPPHPVPAHPSAAPVASGQGPRHGVRTVVAVGPVGRVPPRPPDPPLPRHRPVLTRSRLGVLDQSRAGALPPRPAPAAY